MTVLLVAPFRLAGTGGIATVLRCLQQSIRLRGHRVLSLLDGDAETVQAIQRSNWPDTYGIHFRGAFVRRARLKGFVAFWLYLPISLWSLARFLRRERIDIVHLQFPMPTLWRFAILRPFSGWKLIATVHGSDVYGLRSRTWLYQLLVHQVLARADRITAVSSDLLRTLTTRYPDLAARSGVIPNGMPLVVDDQMGLRELPEGMPENFILAVGSLIERKGYDVLIKALGFLRQRGCELNLVIVGGGPEVGRLLDLAQQLHVDTQVFLAGEVSHSDISMFYSRARFVVHAAREEGFGLVLLEAMACRKAVIATRVGGIPEFVRDGETGVLVEPDNVALLAAAIMRVNQDQSLRQSLAAQGHAFVTEQYGWDQHTQRYLEAYAELLDEPNAGEPDIGSLGRAGKAA